MNPNAAERLNQAVTLLFSSLNAGQPQDDLKYYRNSYNARSPYAFGIMEKRREGPRNERRFDHGGITQQECITIEMTSQTPEEIAERMRLLIIEKKNTAKMQSPRMVSLDEVEAIAEKRLLALLSSPKLQELLASRGATGTAAEVAKQTAAATATAVTPPELLPMDPSLHEERKNYNNRPRKDQKRLPPRQAGKLLDAAIALWTERDKMMGGTGELPFLKNRRVIQPGWVAQRQRDWDAYCQKTSQPAASPSA